MSVDKIKCQDIEEPESVVRSAAGSELEHPVLMQKITKMGSEEGRYVYECNGKTVYEWEQSLEGNYK